MTDESTGNPIEVGLESTCEAMFAAATPHDESLTALRCFGFDATRIALVFNGPEAEALAFQFIRYAEALTDTLADAAKAQEARRGGVKPGLPNAALNRVAEIAAATAPLSEQPRIVTDGIR